MHYTSIENIHKVIDPLFLEELNAEYESIIFEDSNNSEYLQTILDKLSVEEEKARKEGDRAKIKEIENEIRKQKSKHKRKSTYEKGTKIKKLSSLETKISNLKFLDPACGSGNFLTETYISLRRLENKIIEQLNYLDGEIKGQITEDGTVNPIQVSISQFYGIEINDFAVAVAKTALWIAESQMMRETEEILRMHLDFLPLKTNAFIHEGNALRVDWNDIIDKHELNYIMGNPPFLGYSNQNKVQKKDILSVYVDQNGKPYKTAGKIDYVSGWYYKASQLIDKTTIRTAFVSTNSITQGEQVANVWEPLLRFNIHIDFAYKTFVWNSEASNKASVHCVIIGFSSLYNCKNKYIYDGKEKLIAKKINPYLLDGDNILVKSVHKPLSKNRNEMCLGSLARDEGHLSNYTQEEYINIINKYPDIKDLFKPIVGASEYINNRVRYCLWLKDVPPEKYNKNQFIMSQLQKVKTFRELSVRKGTIEAGKTPALFAEIRQPKSQYLLFPRTSSSKRQYVPIGFVTPDIIANDACSILPDATIYDFGILMSNIHNAWVRTVAGRLKSDYRYSNITVYNTFPWPTPATKQKEKIEETAQEILDVRAKFSDSSLADLYNPLTMPLELRKAHQQNDAAVMKAYGFSKDMTESEIVAELMKLYQQYTSK